MDHTILLVVLQTMCATVSAMLVIILIMSRYHFSGGSGIYETSRWQLATAMFFLSVHFVLQIVFGFRAQGADIGALVNILFYAPVAFTVNYVNIRMATGSKHVSVVSWMSVISYLLMLGCAVYGWFFYQSLHMKNVLYVMGTLFFVTLALMYPLSIRNIRRVQRQVEDETSDDIKVYKMHMMSGYYLLCWVSLIIPIVIFVTKLLVVFAPFFMLLLTFYIVSFICIGYTMSSISDVVDEITEGEDSSGPLNILRSPTVSKVEKPKLTSEQIELIEAAIDKWRKEGGFSMMNTTSATMARRIGVPKKDLIQYLSEVKGETFRVWLSNIRIEEAKRLLLEKEGYNNEAIALECGFSSRSWMYEKFKASTGMTPSEWRDNMKKLNTEE